MFFHFDERLQEPLKNGAGKRQCVHHPTQQQKLHQHKFIHALCPGLKHGASLYKEAELFSLPITNPKGRHKTKRLISKTMTLHVRYRFWYISLPSSAKQQREMNMYVLHCILIIYHLSFYISENVVL